MSITGGPVAFDLFSGAGGATCGLRDAGYDVHAFENDPDAADTHDANHERPTHRVDLSTMDWTGWATPDLMWASPPCQPFSAAGDQEGEFDERDGFPWLLDAVEHLLPPVLITENVKGLTFVKHAVYFSSIILRLHRLGYDARWRVLDCADFGVPQNRERTIIVARRDGGRIVWPPPTHTAGDSLFLRPWVTMADALGQGDLASVEHQRGAGMVERYGVRPTRDAQERPAPAITSGAQLRLLLNTHRGLRADGSTQTRDPGSAPAPAPALTAKAGGQWTLERPATTIAGDPRVMRPGRHDPAESGSQMRDAIRLEPHELAALQAFPPGYRFVGTKTSVCTQIGNACPAPLVEAVVTANRPAHLTENAA